MESENATGRGLEDRLTYLRDHFHTSQLTRGWDALDVDHCNLP